MKAKKFMKIQPCDFDNTFNGLERGEVRELIDELEVVATKAAERAAYLEIRYGYGSRDQGHGKAVKYFNKVRKSVRTALGYTLTEYVRF